MSGDGKGMNVFERYLTVWVAVCMALGVALGKLLHGLVSALRGLEFGENSHINIPIAVLTWLMIYPMMLKVDFGSVLGVRKRPRGLSSRWSSTGWLSRSRWPSSAGCSSSTCSCRSSANVMASFCHFVFFFTSRESGQRWAAGSDAGMAAIQPDG